MGEAAAGLTRRMRALAVAAVLALGAAAGAAQAPAAAAAAGPHTCPSAAALAQWQQTLGAAWLDCHQVADLTTTGNPWTDPGDLTGMGLPPGQGSGTLDSKYSNPTSPAVPGIQIDGYWPDSCNGFQSEPTLTNKDGQPWFPGCTPTAPADRTCDSGCHNDGQFVIRIPDAWDGKLMTAGTPGIRDAYASDFVFSDFAMEKGWAYVSQDKGNMGANFYRDGSDEIGSCGTPWCPAAAIAEWTARMRQATTAARALLSTLAPSYGQPGVTKSYAVGISNGGYQVRRALETDTGPHRLYDGGVDWEGTLFSNAENLFSYLPTALAQYPADAQGQAAAVQAMSAVGFNPQSVPLWNYHWAVYWGLTQKVYRLEFDPEYTGYSCSDPTGVSGALSPCVAPPADEVAPQDPDATYDYQARLKANPALAARMQSVANTGDIHAPLITLQGDQDSLLPIRTDADLYARMVAAAGHGASFRYYPVAGGNHVDPQFDDHYGVDSYGNDTLRPMLPCVWSAIDAMDAWATRGAAPPASHTIPRPAGASPQQLANECSLNPGAPPTIPAGASAPPRAPALSITIRTGRTVVRHRRVRVRLACRGGAGRAVCRGTLALAARRGGRRIARARYAVARGHSRVIVLRLSAQWVRRVRRARRHRLSVRATATLRGGRTARRTILVRA